ncbi:MAG: hypothetical protein E7Z69_00795 [Thermoplasmata archaeon]|nr:hypothetical protein [Thermoplasmata archaeon]
MTGWNVLDFGNKTNAKVLAILMVAILTVSGALVFVTNSEATTEYKEGGSITYYLGNEVYEVDATGHISNDKATNYDYNIAADGKRSSGAAKSTSEPTTVKLNTYFGIKSTEYNPEFWTGWGEVYLYESNGNSKGMWNFVGPKATATWSGVGTTVTKPATASSISIAMPDGCTLVSVTSGGEMVDGKLQMDSSAGSAVIIIDYSAEVNKVFGGWAYHNQPDTMIYPGDTVAWTVTELDAKWITPDLYAKTNVTVTDISNGTGSISSIVTPYANWNSGTNPRDGYTYNFTENTVDGINGIDSPTSGQMYTVRGDPGKLTIGTEEIYVVAGDVVKWDGDKWVKDHDGMFSSIYLLKRGTEYKMPSGTLVTGTYRTADPYGIYDLNSRNAKIDYKAIFHTGSAFYLSGNVVIDNITLDCNQTNTHGGSVAGAFVAQGHRFIVGTNMTTLHLEKSTDYATQADRVIRAPNIIGGLNSSNLNRVIEYDKTAILNDGKDSTVEVDLGTYVIVHSGIFNNVIAGSAKDTIGTAQNPLSTYMILKDCLIVDTIGGAGGTSGVNGHNGGDGYLDGGTFVYAIGAYAMGDYWEDKESGYSDFVSGCGPADNTNGNIRLYTLSLQSSVAQGGSTTGDINGCTHLIITGDSSIWDSMGAGRDGTSQTDFSYLEVTGRAEVRRVACGITTDGSSGSKDNVVDGVFIHVSEDALVASVYGGGFDTWSYPSGRTMSHGTITIDITGGRIGDVYGGGYRGTIGNSADTSALKISISISGDTHIEGNVYGGGSGGLNKMKHAAAAGNISISVPKPDDTGNETVTKSFTYGEGFQTTDGVTGNRYSSGRSYVYGNIDIDIAGGTIDGDVYGGGMSVPKLVQYDNIEWGLNYGDIPFLAERSNNQPVETATVVGNVSVTVEGDAKVGGSVYGAGKGIKLDSKGEVDKSEYGFNKVVYRDGDNRSISRQYWVEGGENSSSRAYDNSSDLNYPNFAQVKGNVTVTIKNNTWYHDQTAIVGTTYTVSASDADANKFIVLHRGTNLPSKYNVVLVDENGNASMMSIASGQPTPGGYDFSEWKVKGRVIGTVAYTVTPEDADLSKTIVLYHPQYSTAKYDVLMIDGDTVTAAPGESESAVVALNTSHIDGSVYGGGGFGKVIGSTIVSVDSGIVGTNVFGGGLGVAGRTCIEGNRVVYIQNISSIGGSVFGGSEVGVDGPVISEDELDSKVPATINKVKQQLHANRAGVVVQGGFIEGSIFGGGLMGKTYGNTAVYVGYYLPSLTVRTPVPVNYSDSTGIKISVNSIFAGGNISSSGEDDTSIVGAYTQDLVMGSGFISIYGDENKSVSIPGSIMGSGNACKTRGETEIEIVNLFNADVMAGIHRATKVTIDRCNIAITGRSTVTEIFSQVKMASIFDIEELILKGGTSINFRNPIDDVKTLKSQTSDGSLTTAKSAQNRLVFTGGTTIYVRYADENGNPVYGNVEGFTLMISTQGDYGAYAMGNTLGGGGFAVNKDGSTAEADTSISGNICCWYVSGISKKISTMYLQLDDDSRNLEYNEAYITINKFQTDTSIMFTGGVFTKMSNDPNGDPYTFVRPGADSMEDEPSQLALAIGYNKNDGQRIPKLYDPTYRYMSIADGQVINQPGTFFTKDGMESDIDGANKNRSLVSVPMAYSTGASSASGPMNIYLCLTGRPIDSTAYVGYVTLVFQEIKQVNYEAVGPDGTIINTPRYLVANTIELRVDIYIYGSPTSESSDTFSVEVKTNVDGEGYREGSASTLIPQTYAMAELNLARVDIVGAGSGRMGGTTMTDGAVYEIPESRFIAPEGKTFDEWKITSGNGIIFAHPTQYLYVCENGGKAFILDGIGTVATINALTNRYNGLTYIVSGVSDVVNPGSVSVTAGDIVRFNGTNWAKIVLASADADLPITGKAMTITPVWKDVLKVVFDHNGGRGSIATVPIGRGTEYVLPESDGFVAPSGDAFAYWSVTVGDSRAVIRHPGETIIVDGDTVVKAIWSPKVTVSFDHGSYGSGSMGNVLAPSGQRYTLPMSDFVADTNYEFGTWSYKIKNGESVIADVTGKYPGDTVKIPDNATSMILTANWLHNPTKFTVTYVANGGTASIDRDLTLGNIVSNVDGWYVKGNLANNEYIVADSTTPYVKDIKKGGDVVFHVDSFNNVYNAVGTRVSTVLYTDPECMDVYSVGTDIGATTVYTKGYTVAAGDKDTNNFIILYQVPNDAEKYTVIIVPASGSPVIYRNYSVGASIHLPNGNWVAQSGTYSSTYPVTVSDADDDRRFIILYQDNCDMDKITALHVAMATDKVADGTKYRLPECTISAPSSYTFSGWSVAIGGGSPAIYQPGTVLAISGNTTVTALWSTEKCIRFAHGEESKGEGDMANQYAPYGAEYTIPWPDTITAKSGYRFLCWNDGVDKYYPGQAIVIGGDILLTAMWEPTTVNTHAVYFDPLGEGGYMAMVEKDHNAKYVLPNCGYVSTDKVFLRWLVYHANSPAPESKNPGETITVDSDIAVRAIWAAKIGGGAGAYTVIFVGDNDSDTDSTFYRSQRAGDEIHLTGDFFNVTYHTKSGVEYKDSYVVDPADADSYSYILLYKSDLPSNPKTYAVVTIVGFEATVQLAIAGSDVILPTHDPLFCKNNEVKRDAENKYRVNPDDAVSETFRYIIQNTGNHIEFVYDANHGTGQMKSQSVIRSLSRYVLPASTFTAPEGMVFDKWSITSNDVTITGYPGQSLIQRNLYGYLVEGYATVGEINAMIPASVAGKKYCVIGSGTITTSGLPVNDGDIVHCKEVSTGVYAWVIANENITIDATEIYMKALWKEYDDDTEVKVEFSSGTVIEGIVTVTAEANQDNTTGWSNLGRPVMWNIRTGALYSDSDYIGTLLGSIVGNVSFAVSGLKAIDSSGEVFMPSVDLVFDRGGAEAHTTLTFADIKEYSVVFIDHGLETVRTYPENTQLTRDMCETPTGNNFNGWYLDPTFVNRYDYNMVINDESDGLRLYARYTYVVTLDCQNGVKYTLQVSEEDNGALLNEGELPVPDYIGYDFEGWCKDPATVYDWSYQSDRVYEDITLYARWIGKEVRIYFWYEDSDGVLRLFDGNPVGQEPDAKGKYDLENSYMLDTERRLYPTVTWGGTFDIRNPYNGDIIIDYVQETIHFEGSFVKWTVVSPTDSSKHIGIYGDTVVGSKVLQYVTDDMLKEFDNDMWEYYIYNDGGYPRKNWEGPGKPNTMEIHLKAETTKVAIRVQMGLSEEDQKYSPTVTIDDPESFLVYPNGPNLNNPGTYVGSFYDEFGELYYAGTDGDPARYWKDGKETDSPYTYIDGKLVRKDDHSATPKFYWNKEGTIRYYYDDKKESCWTCLDEKDAITVDSHLEPGGSSIKYIAFPKNGKQEYRPISAGDHYGNTLDSKSPSNLKSVAYAKKNGVEETFLVEWNIENTSYTVADPSNSTKYRKDIKFNESPSYPVIFHITKDTNKVVNDNGEEISITFYTDTARTIPYDLADGGNGNIYADTSYVRKYYEFVEFYEVVDGEGDYVKYAQVNHVTKYKIKADKTVYETDGTKTNFKFYENEDRTVVYDPNTSSATKIYLVAVYNKQEYLYFTNVTNNDTNLQFYLKDEAGLHYTVTMASRAIMYLKPESGFGNYHEFVFKLNNAVRNGYSLHGWHNEYISWENKMTPSADQVRKVYLWHDDEGYVTSAKLISVDNAGNYVEIPLLVGDYVVDSKDADASGNITLVPDDSQHAKPVNSTVTKIINQRWENDLITLDPGTWYVNGKEITDADGSTPGTQYKVVATDADIEGSIIITDSVISVTQYTVILVSSDGIRTVLGKFAADTNISLDDPGSSRYWMSKYTRNITTSYTVNSKDADSLGNITIKDVLRTYSPQTFTVKIVDKGCVNGSTLILNSISDTTDRGFDGWIVNDRDLDGDDYTLVTTDADKDRFVVLFKTENDNEKYTVIVIGDTGVTVGRNLTAGVSKVDLDKGIWYCSTSESTEPVQKDSNNRYTVTAGDADGNRFIVLYKTANDTGEYTVVKVNGSDASAISGQSAGALVSGVGGWHVKNRTVDNSVYTVRSDDADVIGSIVLATKWKDLTKYNVIWINGSTPVHTDSGQMVGHEVIAPHVEKEGQTFLGWKAATGIIDDAYVVSHQDKVAVENGVGVIKLYALWSGDQYSGYRVIKASDKGGYTVWNSGYVESATVVLNDFLTAEGYTHTDWRIITGNNPRLITAPRYTLDPNDADAQHDIIIVADWVKTYTVTVGDNDPVYGVAEGDNVSLTYPSSEYSSLWKVREDLISQGDKINDPDHTFTMKYNAVWNQIPYSVHMAQPVNGVIEVYMESRDGSSTSKLLTDEEINNMVFYHGDKLRLSYTPNNSKVSFIKWVVTNTSYLENSSSPSTVLVIQSDCSIAVDESTGRMVDIMIAFDNGTLDPKDREFTRVFLRDTSSGEYYEASFIAGMVNMDHYVVKVPYGDGYETVLWYGWGHPGPDGSFDTLDTFEDAPDEYVLVGTVDVSITNAEAVVYDVISAGFIDTINEPNTIADFVDTEYGIIEREYETDPKFDFLFTSDEYSVDDGTSSYAKDIKKNGITVYNIDINNKVYDASSGKLVDIKFYTRSDCLKSSVYDVGSIATTVYTPIIKGSNGGNIVLYDNANDNNKYTVVTVNGSTVNSYTLAEDGTVTLDSGWHLKGRLINGNYTVKARDADDGGFIVIYKTTAADDKNNVIKAVKKQDGSYTVSIEPNMIPGAEITLAASGWHIRDTTIVGTKYYVNPNDAYPGASEKSLENTFRFASGTGAGHPVRIIDSQNNVVAKITKYVGIQRSILGRLAANNLNINNPDGGTPPVVINFDPNLTYTTYEGFPWKDVSGRNVFALESDINLAVGADSNKYPQKTFYLNWVRTDSPADVIMQLSSTKLPANYAVADVRIVNENGGHDKIFDGVRYDLGSEESDSDASRFIVIYESPNALETYTVIKQTALNAASSERGLTIGGEVTVDGSGWKIGKTGEAATITEGKYIVRDADADENGFIVLYLAANDSNKYSAIKVGDSATTAVPNKSKGDHVTGVDGWHVADRTLHGDYIVDPEPYYHVDAPLDNIAGYVPVPEVYNGGNIIVYQAPNPTGPPAVYTVVKVPSTDDPTSVSRKEAGYSVTDLEGNWYVKGRQITASYTVDAADADEGGFIVLYQAATADGYYNVIMVDDDYAVSSFAMDKPAGTPVSGVRGWYVKGEQIAPSYTVSDSTTQGYVKDVKIGTEVKYRINSSNVVYDVATTPSIVSIVFYTDAACTEVYDVRSEPAEFNNKVYTTSYIVDAGDAYTGGMGGDGECRIHDTSKLHLKVPATYDNRLRVMVTYEKSSGWYALNDSTFGYYGNIVYNVHSTGSRVWGTSLELPTSFTTKTNDTPVNISIWVAGLPNGENATIVKENGRFVYDFTKADAISTSDFIYTVAVTHVVGYAKEVLQGDDVKYYINSSNAVFDADTRDPVSIKFFTSWTCTDETAYDVNHEPAEFDGKVYTSTRIIFTPLLSTEFITLSFSTYYGEFDINNSQRVSVSVPAGGTMAEYTRNMAELKSVSRFITTYSTGSWEYVFDGFYWGETKLNLNEAVPITSSRAYIASWTPNESNKKLFSYTSDGKSSISAMRDAVVAEAIGEGEAKRFVVDTEISMSIQPSSGYVIDLDRTRGELGYTLVGTEIYVDVSTANQPTGSGHSFSSWKLWDAGSPVRAGYKVTELTDSAKNGFLVYIANWNSSAPHAGSITLVFVTDEGITANLIYANDGDTTTIPAGNWKIWNQGGTVTSTYDVDAKAAVDGYILFVKDRMVLNDYNAVFATEYGTVSRATPLDHYYKDTNGNKYYNVDVGEVYRYENSDWTTYTVTNLAGHDGSFIVQFSTNDITYKATREGQFYKATPSTYTATLVDGYITGFRLDASPHTEYTVANGVITSDGKTVNMRLFTDAKLTNRIVNLAAKQTLVSSKIYSGEFVECDPVQGFYAARLEGTSVQGWMSSGDKLGVTGDGWYVGTTPIDADTTISSVSSDAGSFIVAQRGYNNADEKYTVVLVDGNSVSLIRGLSNDDSTSVTGVKGWKVGNTLIDTDSYTVSSNDADAGRFIVLHRYDNPDGKYTVVKLDDSLTYYANPNKTGDPSGKARVYAQPDDVVETYMYAGLVHYLLQPYGSEYVCFETNILQYEIAPYGSQFRDSFGTVWAKDSNGSLNVVSTIVWTIDPTTNLESAHTITDLAKLPAQYWLKDSFGNYYKGNHFAAGSLKIPTLYLTKDDGGLAPVNETLYVMYINDNEYVRVLTTGAIIGTKTVEAINDMSPTDGDTYMVFGASGTITAGNLNVVEGEVVTYNGSTSKWEKSSMSAYLLKRNGDIVTANGKNPVDGTLYYDSGRTQAYYGDYTIVTAVAKYSTDTEVKINGITYHRDGFGNLYYDWIRAPTELSGNRGYTWTFLLKDSIDITIYMKEVSFNINFVVNGNKVKATDMNAISTVTVMNGAIDDDRNLDEGGTAQLDSGIWYSYNTGEAVTKQSDNSYKVVTEDPNAINGFILLYKTANTAGTYTVVKVDGSETTMYRGLSAGDKVALDTETWKCKGETVTKVGNDYVVDSDDATRGFIVLYKTDVTKGKYTVLKVDDAQDYYGTNIGQYTVVAFDGPQTNRGMTWYTDPDYDHEYSVYGDNRVLSPNRFQVDLETPTALKAAGKTFSSWKLFGGLETYAAAQNVTLTGGSQHLGSDTKNYFYIIEADWGAGNGSGEYTIVYASQYGYDFVNGDTANLVRTSASSITLKEFADSEGFNGWKVWNTGSVLTDANRNEDGTQYIINPSDAVTVNGKKYILMVADWGEDVTYANNVVYASEFGEAHKMDSIRKYQFNATRDITLYGHTGTYVLFLHDFDDSRDPMKFELTADENYRITIPQDHYSYGDYIFVGWSAHKENGKRAYTYAPEESINISALDERINLYPYYLSDGTEVKYYDGQLSTLKLGMDDVLRAKQIEPSTDVLAVSYSDSPITEVDPYDPGEPKEAIHAGDYYINYAADIRTPLGMSPSDASHGNTVSSYKFNGKATLKILKVDAYAIAPSAYMREGDGAIIAASSPADLRPGDMSGGNMVFTSEDVTLIGLVVSDVAGKSLYTNAGDKTMGMDRTVVDAPAESLTIKPLVRFTIDPAYVERDYNLKYIDGSLTIYPKDASKYEGDGYA